MAVSGSGFPGDGSRSIDELLADPTYVDRALTKASKDALLRHKKLGNPIAVWRDERVVWIPADQIPVEDDAPEPVGSGR